MKGRKRKKKKKVINNIITAKPLLKANLWSGPAKSEDAG